MTTFVSNPVWRPVRAFGVMAGALALTACVSKSETPLSPSVAGPIPGVDISTPRPMQPVRGAKIPDNQQPITLAVANATTSGVRPLNYLFEVSADSGFTNKVFSRDGITPGDGQTSLRLPDALATGRTYYWRALAQDGANTGAYSDVSTFDVFTPIVIEAPVPVGPANSVTVESLHPKFTFANAPRTGPVGPITYLIEVAENEGFVPRTAAWTSGEQAGQTSLTAPQDLPPATRFFWRVRAADPTAVGPWSPTQVFLTPTPFVAPPPSTGPIGPAPNDALNLGLASVYNSPADIASWPATATITRLEMSSAGLSFVFSQQGSWPDYTPPGWSGPIQYTVWAVVNIAGRWYTSGFIQMWRSRPSTGAPILSDFARNWAYDARWGPMAGYQPHVGEQMGFFVSAGNARGTSGVTSLRQRSNVVTVALPAGDTGVFTFPR